MSEALEDARMKAMGNQRQELHTNVLTLVLGEMIRVSSVKEVRGLLLAIADDLKEFG